MLVWEERVNGGSAYKHWFVTYLATLMNWNHISFSDDEKHAGLLSRLHPEGKDEFRREITETIAFLYNHPSIVVWVPFNECWGQFDALAVCEQIRTLDSSRLVDHASGWFDQKGGDILSLHYYFLKLKFKPESKRAAALTEFGGYSLSIPGHSCCKKVYGYKKFNSTGTLTYGTPRVVLVHSALPFLSDHELYRLCAAAERYSEHPLGKAITHCCQQETGEALEEGENFQMVPRRGVSARVDEKVILAGNAELLAEHHIAIPEEAAKAADTQLSQGCTVTYTAVDGVFAGFLALSDTIREESANMIDRLSALQVQPVLLTGDHQNAAAAIAAQLHIGEVHANCLPEDKLSHIRAYQAVGEKVCMIGDGVNDAPALKAADVGIAMGGVGSDIAVDAADIALVDDEVKELPHLIALSTRMMRTIKLNITFSLTLNFIAIVLAITGTLNPVVGALVHNAGSVLVITNSALLLKWSQTASQSFASADAKSV